MNTNVPCPSTVHHPCTGPPFQTDSCVLGQSMHEVCPRRPCPNKELGGCNIWPTSTFKTKTRLHMVEVEVGKPATWSLLALLKLKPTCTVLKRTPLCRDVLYACAETLWTGANTSKVAQLVLVLVDSRRPTILTVYDICNRMKNNMPNMKASWVNLNIRDLETDTVIPSCIKVV